MGETNDGNSAGRGLDHATRFIEGQEAVADARLLFKECACSLGFNVPFRDFARELAELPGEYLSPAGALLVALRYGEPSGCVAMRPLEVGVCEMKRLHVRHTCRGQGLGRRLVIAVARIARNVGYRAMRVDALPWAREVIAGYRSLGFEPLPPHRSGKIARPQSLELNLFGYQPPWARVMELRQSLKTHQQGGPPGASVRVVRASDSQFETNRRT